ncbi:MAG: squalene--hopene cyclase [Planctomycetota bacterium]|jgi:squalene-hopene/tetraprenyl-beta-curcumene cyclase
MPIELADFQELFGRVQGGTVAPPVPVEVLLDRDIDPDPRPHGLAHGVEQIDLDRAVDRAAQYLLRNQNKPGDWCFELESNIQIEAQWILTMHYLGIADQETERQQKLVAYMRRTQQEDGGWQLHDVEPSDISITVQAYFAAKLAGVNPNEPWMRKACAFVIQQGGVETSSVICKVYLAFFGEFDFKGVPSMPLALMFMPRGTAFNIYEQAYWARTCVIPLLVLFHKRHVHPTPARCSIPELFKTPREKLTHKWDQRVPTISWRNFFIQADRALKAFEKLPVNLGYSDKACKIAEQWLLDHQDEDGGWGGIFPAMTHSVMALKALGYPADSGPLAKGIQAIKDLEVDIGDGSMWVQPCMSPVWDTAWAVIALSKAGYDRDHEVVERATNWLYSMQIRKPGDWSQKCPGVVPGGWAFQYFNDYYPDTDDSAVVLMSLLNSHYRDDEVKKESFDVGIQWLLGLQNKDGGWGAFERGVDNEIYNEILFNDAKNMLDPSTVDVTGRCLEVLGKLGYPQSHKALRKAVRYVLSEQEADGKWWGRWGVNYIYGTWSALCGLAAAKVPPHAEPMVRAADWLESIQLPDGGWSESCDSYRTFAPTENTRGSSASQTAWAVMGLLAAGRASSESCRRGAEWLIANMNAEGSWSERHFTGTGFPNVFYLRYDGYARYFPLLALARYREALQPR